jgi:GDP-4-dehydro-6-deoxy-D-mannose reductase
MSNVAVEVKNDPARMRPSDIPSMVSDNTRFHRLTGWQPTIPLEETLRDILTFWREKVRSS